jgi:hypothetical protein
MDGFKLSAELRNLLPSCLVIHRDYAGAPGGDDGLHIKKTPGAFLADQRKKLTEVGDMGIWVYVNNEPAFDSQSIQWFCDLIELNALAPAPLRLIIGNWSVGNPNADDWHKADKMLRLLDQYREWCILGLHEYFCAVPTSGFLGGYPNNAGVRPGQPGGENLIFADHWPAKTQDITLFHCGRFRFAVKRCQELGIQAPRIILSEHGADDVSDIKAWTNTLTRTPGYEDIRGWQSLEAQWRQWYPTWTHQQTYYEMLSYLDKAIYRDSAVEAQLLFTWSNAQDWKQFDVQTAFALHNFLERSAQDNNTPVSNQDKPAVFYPVNFEQRAIEVTIEPALPGFGYNIRQLPLLTSKILVKHMESIRAQAIPAHLLEAEELAYLSQTIEGREGFWLPVREGVIKGYVHTSAARVIPVIAQNKASYTLRFEIPGLDLTPDQASSFVHNIVISLVGSETQ